MECVADPVTGSVFLTADDDNCGQQAQRLNAIYGACSTKNTNPDASGMACKAVSIAGIGNVDVLSAPASTSNDGNVASCAETVDTLNEVRGKVNECHPNLACGRW